MLFEFDSLSEQKAKLKVVGVGGAGGNAVTRMITSGMKGVDFIAINTDAQDLDNNPSEQKVQIGKNLTKGLGAGANSNVGRDAVESDKEAITSLLEGVIKRGTGKKLRKLELNLAGKTGTTNENTDAWFIGFTSNFVIGVYVGMDDPSPLGKFETGSKTALPIFENFVMKAVKKSDARPFKVPNGITMMVVDPITGDKAKFSSKNTIVEAYKSKNVINGKVLYSNYDRLDTNNILKFY